MGIVLDHLPIHRGDRPGQMAIWEIGLYLPSDGRRVDAIAVCGELPQQDPPTVNHQFTACAGSVRSTPATGQGTSSIVEARDHTLNRYDRHRDVQSRP